MPLSSPKRKVSDTENKLRVLCCLEALGMATQEQLWPFVARLELMEYVPFCMFVDELQKGGSIAKADHALEGMLYLTVEGQQLLKLFSNRLVHTDRERIHQAAPEYAAQLTARRQVQAGYELAPEGRCCAACAVREDDVPTLVLRMDSADCALVENAVQHFRELVPRLLTLLYTIPFLSCQEDSPAPETQQQCMLNVRPGSPALCAFGGREHAAVVRVEDETTAYTLLLLLPDAALAWGWALAADQMGAKLAQRITGVLENKA